MLQEAAQSPWPPRLGLCILPPVLAWGTTSEASLPLRPLADKNVLLVFPTEEQKEQYLMMAIYWVNAFFFKAFFTIF